MKLIANNPTPQQPDEQTRLNALLRRAVMEVESAPASYFGDGFCLEDDARVNSNGIAVKKEGREQ